MGRKRLYTSIADRQRAYRSRCQARQGGQPIPPIVSRRPPSRPARLVAIQEAIQGLKGEYEQWLEALPPSLAESTLAERLQETIEQLDAASDLLDGIDPPKGFGRD